MAKESKPEGKPAEKKDGEAVKPVGAKPAGAPAEKPKVKKEEKKGKRVRSGRKHFKTDVYKFYKIEDGKAVTGKQPCPRCGPGTWLADHKGRKYCGRCSYTIFEKK